MTDRVKLKSLRVSGFKSFAATNTAPAEGDGHTLNLGGVTLLLGANGAGKSNVVSLFRHLQALGAGGLENSEALRELVGRLGGADSMLHFGAATTQSIEVAIQFQVVGTNIGGRYSFMLVHAAPDTLQLGAQAFGSFSSTDREALRGQPPTDRRADLAKPRDLVSSALAGIRVYQFHDTSSTSRIRRSNYIEDARELVANAGNLAPFLRALQTTARDHYLRVVTTIRQVCPAFDDFDLQPTQLDPTTMLLNWRASGRPDYLLGPHQLSDGTIRFMALAALLLQPPDRLPPVLVIDEPELGLHPSAIAILAGLVKQASHYCQVVLATQSPTLVDWFDLDQLRVIQMKDGASRFLDIDTVDLQQWLEDYTLGELWQKNMFQGGPERA